MILTDGSHLVSTESAQELHAFARQVGLKHGWYQAGHRHPHYDVLSQRLMDRAYSLGAVNVSTRELLSSAWWAKQRDLTIGNGPACNPYEGATPEQMEAETHLG